MPQRQQAAQDEAPRPAPAAYAALPDGRCRYRLEGPADGHPLLLVHGATVPHWQFDALAPLLNAAGYRTLRHDLPGHGDSDRPRGPYALERFVRQTRGLLDYVGWYGSLSILGHSFGAAVTAALTAALADDDARRVRAVVLTAPLLDFAAAGPMLRVLRTPIFGGVFMRFHGMRALTARRHRRFAEIGRPELIARFDDQVARPGFRQALVSMARHGAFGPHGAVYEQLGRSGVPVRVLWGDQDPVIPRTHAETVARLAGSAPPVALAGLEHNLLLTAPERVLAAVSDFLCSGAPA